MSLEHHPARSDAAGGLADWATVEGFVERHEGLFTEAQLRWALRFRSENGLAAHVRRFGRKLYLNEPGFITWFEAQGREG